MTFENLLKHLEEEGCTLQETSNPSLFLATNVIMLTECYVEKLDYYKIDTLCYYIWMLKIGVPSEVEDLYEVYSNIYSRVS